jgi:hypothetical protein
MPRRDAASRPRPRHRLRTYVRIDFYASRVGCVFGEFSPTPAKGNFFSPFADRYFERIWRETFPEEPA